MRLKNIASCSAFAWSPKKAGSPPMLAMATYYGSMEDDFSNDSFLSIHLCDVNRTDETELPVKGRARLPDRAYRVDWSTHTGAQGIVAVACGNGSVYIYSVAKMLAAGPSGEAGDALLWTISEHHCPVRACHFNPSQQNFLAVGADDGKWFIWSIPSQAGNNSSPQKVAVINSSVQQSAITDIQWHPKFPQIVATATSGGLVSVWNLKNLSLVSTINVAKYGKGSSATCIAWNPEIATVIAVGLDNHPVVQVWNLKKFTAPEHELVGHNQAVTGLSWNATDTGMLASCSADGATAWWDPKTGEKLGELEQQSDFIIDVQWCPVITGVLATSSIAPLLCVSTAEDSRSPENATGAVSKWMQRPCGASVNNALQVCKLVPGSTAEIEVVSIAPTRPITESGSNAASVSRMQQDVAQCPPNTKSRFNWLQQHGFGLLAALSDTMATGQREPVLNFICESGENGQKDSEDVNGDDPFEEIQKESNKSFEDRATELVASGKIEEAVDFCLENNKFEDAFALAFLKGELLAKVQSQLIEYVAREESYRRHILFAGAIANGDFTNLIRANVPWREVLSAIVSFVGANSDQVTRHLGNFLQSQGELEGALACFVISKDVNAVVDLWSMQQIPDSELVFRSILLEETTGSQITNPLYMTALCNIGEELLQEGYVDEAMRYITIAAKSDERAQTLADQYRFVAERSGNMKRIDVPPPFPHEPISDRPSPSCQEFFASLAQRQRPASQQPQSHPAIPPMQNQPPQMQNPFPQADRQANPAAVQPQNTFQSPPNAAPPFSGMVAGKRPPLLGGNGPMNAGMPNRGNMGSNNNSMFAHSSPPPTQNSVPPQSFPPSQQNSMPVAPEVVAPRKMFGDPPPRLMPNPVSDYSSANRAQRPNTGSAPPPAAMAGSSGPNYPSMSAAPPPPRNAPQMDNNYPNLNNNFNSNTNNYPGNTNAIAPTAGGNPPPPMRAASGYPQPNANNNSPPNFGGSGENVPSPSQVIRPPPQQMPTNQNYNNNNLNNNFNMSNNNGGMPGAPNGANFNNPNNFNGYPGSNVNNMNNNFNNMGTFNNPNVSGPGMPNNATPSNMSGSRAASAGPPPPPGPGAAGTRPPPGRSLLPPPGGRR